jgi:hypothetical protein
MFIEFEIKENPNGSAIRSIININNILYIDNTSDEGILSINVVNDCIRFVLKEENVNLVYYAFKRALSGDSVTIDDIGYIRPLNHQHPSKTNPMWPVTAISWRDVP